MAASSAAAGAGAGDKKGGWVTRWIYFGTFWTNVENETATTLICSFDPAVRDEVCAQMREDFIEAHPGAMKREDLWHARWYGKISAAQKVPIFQVVNNTLTYWGLKHDPSRVFFAQAGALRYATDCQAISVDDISFKVY